MKTKCMIALYVFFLLLWIGVSIPKIVRQFIPTPVTRETRIIINYGEYVDMKNRIKELEGGIDEDG